MYKIKFKDNKLTDKQPLQIRAVSENNYEISLKRGHYNIRVYAKSKEAADNVNLEIALNGKKKAPIWINGNSVISKDYKANVNDGILKVEFFGEQAYIQGIDISRQIKEIPKNIEYKLIADFCKSSLVLVWTGKSEHYHIYREEHGSGEAPQLIKVHGKAFFDDDVKLCRTYTYFIKAIDALGFEGTASEKLTVQIIDHTRFKLYPRNFHIKSNEDKSITLAWDQIKGVSNYVIYKADESNEFKQICRLSGNILEYKDTDIKCKCKYKYAIETESLGGISNRSVTTAYI